MKFQTFPELNGLPSKLGVNIDKPFFFPSDRKVRIDIRK